MHLGFLVVGQSWLISVLYHLVNHQNTQLNAEIKNQALNRHIFRVLGRLYNLILCKEPCILGIVFRHELIVEAPNEYKISSMSKQSR